MDSTPHTSPASGLSVGFVSLGCAKNLVDSQIMAGVLIRDQLRLAAAPEEADIVVVNTCSFVHDARTESLESIRTACAMKKRGPCRAVIVTGCLPQRYRDRLVRELPGVDAFLGLDELDRIGDVVRQLAAGKRGLFEVSEQARRLYDPALPGLVFSTGCHAYLKIAEGCNHGCAFCAIPGIRGRHRSRPPASLVSEAEHILAQGIREIDLISQDIFSYGRDLGAGTTLASLIRQLGRVGGRFWIRLLYGYPTGLTDDLLDAIAETHQVCRYVDIPVQHSHPAILRAMRRGATAAAVQSLPERLRDRIPGIALRTTCLVGFPGETADHFQHLLDYVTRAEFDHLGVFTFSPEEGTPAFTLGPPVAATLAEERRARLLEQQQSIVRRRARNLVGTEAEVLLETQGSREPRLWTGRSGRQAPDVDGFTRVRLADSKNHRGEFLRVRYQSVAGYDLKAVPVEG
jgi:ribosomal protein S12 methylthiotransferase